MQGYDEPPAVPNLALASMSLQVASLPDRRRIIGRDNYVYEVEIPQVIQAVEPIFPHVPDQRKCGCPKSGTHRTAHEHAVNRGDELFQQVTVPDSSVRIDGDLFIHRDPFGRARREHLLGAVGPGQKREYMGGSPPRRLIWAANISTAGSFPANPIAP